MTPEQIELRAANHRLLSIVATLRAQRNRARKQRDEARADAKRERSETILGYIRTTYCTKCTGLAGPSGILCHKCEDANGWNR